MDTTPPPAGVFRRRLTPPAHLTRATLAPLLCSVFQVFNGYFVHFFAPENMDPIPKNILFVIDVSGSMWGVKMKQVSTPCGQRSVGPLPPHPLSPPSPARVVGTASCCNRATQAGTNSSPNPAS